MFFKNTPQRGYFNTGGKNTLFGGYFLPGTNELSLPRDLFKNRRIERMRLQRHTTRLTIINDLPMEMKNLEKVEALSIKALLKEVKELKDALEAKSIKEEIIAVVLQEQDREKLGKIAKALRNVIDPGRPGDGGAGTEPAGQGNETSIEELILGQTEE